jgi:hypothetical protein
MMNPESQEQSAASEARAARRLACAGLSRSDCNFLLGYIREMDPGTFDLALAALAGTLAREAAGEGW